MSSSPEATLSLIPHECDIQQNGKIANSSSELFYTSKCHAFCSGGHVTLDHAEATNLDLDDQNDAQDYAVQDHDVQHLRCAHCKA